MADDAIPFDRTLTARPEEVTALSPLVRRLVANNGGPFTFTGTCTYVVGRGEVAVIDPGPADPTHVAALVQAMHEPWLTSKVLSNARQPQILQARRFGSTGGLT